MINVTLVFRLGQADNCHGTIDIPHDMGSRDKYQATIGHKLNDNPFHTHGDYVAIDHPRFGNIMAVQSERDINKGEEVFAFYGYSLRQGGGPRWYQNTLMAGVIKCRSPKSHYWPVPLTHFDRVFCDNSNWNRQQPWDSVDKWLSYITWKRYLKGKN